MSTNSELAAGLLMEADAIRKVLDHGRSQGLYPQYLGNAERGLRKAAAALMAPVEVIRHKDFTVTRPAPGPSAYVLDILTLTAPGGETATMLRSTYDDLFARGH